MTASSRHSPISYSYYSLQLQFRASEQGFHPVDILRGHMQFYAKARVGVAE
jgi:hypothetical protein